MRRLSSPLDALGRHHPVVVVGSGYGGAVAAARLARAGLRVCVLERGRELHPGEYPRSSAGFLKEVQADLPDKRLGPPTGLFDLRYNDDLNVILGCGLGGGSLINSGACGRPDPRVFDDPRWPDEIRGEPAMAEFFALAEEMLRPASIPPDFPRLAKLDALARSAGHLGEPLAALPVLVNFAELPGGRNHAGVEQRPCVGCGDCESGCNYGAKNSVLMNYLPDAARHGAALFSQVAVRHLEREGEGWRVHLRRLDRAGDEPLAVAADVVVLAAGTLGSTEILLRSAARGLALSPALGSRFSGNGDAIGFSYNCDREIHGVGLGDREPGELPVTGPCVADRMIDARAGRPLDEGLVLEAGGVPGALAGWLPALFAAAAKLAGRDTDSGLRDRVAEQAREIESKLRGAYAGAVDRTQTYLAVAHDDSGGTMSLVEDRLRIRWPGVGRQAEILRADAMMRRATEALGGTYVRNPTWNTLTGQQLLTGHPLGGCPMAGDARDGVVDHRGRVYASSSGTAVHRGLFVMDGAVIPRSLGINPLLTIAALAERSCSLLVGEAARDRR